MKIAIVGAGGAAKLYVERFIDLSADELTCFTSSGEGTLLDKKAERLCELRPELFDKVVVCSQFVDEIIGSMQDCGMSMENIHIFDVKKKTTNSLNPENLTYVNGKTLYAYYRLSRMSLAFNYVFFVNNAQAYAKLHGYKKIVFIVASGRFGYVNYGGSLAYSAEQQFWRLSNLLPMISQLSKDYCSYLHFDSEMESDDYLKSKSADDIFPDNAVQKHYFTKIVEASYTIGPCLLMPHCNEVQCLEPIQQSIDYIGEEFLPALKGKKVVTITLRETTFDTSRNSNLTEWQKFSEYLLDKGYQPVILRDTSKALSLPEEDFFPGAVFLSAAAFNIHIRTAIYKLAFANLGTDSGAVGVALFMKNVKFCFFFSDCEATKQVLEHEIATAEKSGLKTTLKVGENYPFLGEKQKLVWKDESFENIVDEFEYLTN